MGRTWSLLLVLALVVPFTGCFSPDGVAEVPASALSSKGWGESGGEDGSAAASLVKYHVREYRPNGARSDLGRVVVVTAPDIPLLDEANIVSEQLKRIAEQEGFELRNPQQSKLTLASGLEVAQTVYTVADWSVGEARLREVQWGCSKADAHVAAIGYGVTSAGLDASGTFRDTEALVQAVSCP